MFRPENNAPANPFAEPAGEAQFVTVCMGEETYALGVGYIREIRAWDGGTRVLNTPDYVRGVMNLCGTLVPVFDLNAPFQATATQASKQQVVVLSHGEDTIGLLVDEISNPIAIRADEIQPIPPVIMPCAPSFLGGFITRGQQTIALLDVKKIFHLTREGMVDHLYR